jgi:hypothetical protein
MLYLKHMYFVAATFPEDRSSALRIGRDDDPLAAWHFMRTVENRAGTFMRLPAAKEDDVTLNVSWGGEAALF